jgi:hypothetical protein
MSETQNIILLIKQTGVVTDKSVAKLARKLQIKPHLLSSIVHHIEKLQVNIVDSNFEYSKAELNLKDLVCLRTNKKIVLGLINKIFKINI